jgi:type VI secretion system secreted protein Hcp
MATDFFLKLDGIPGESKDSKHPAEIQLESWSWGESNAGTFAAGGGGGAGKVNMQDFHFTMPVNIASPKLMLACASGEHIKSAILTARKAGGQQQEYLKITFSELLVSSYQIGGSGHSDSPPVDSISLAFTKLEYEYKPQKADGTLDAATKVGYDVKANKKV